MFGFYCCVSCTVVYRYVSSALKTRDGYVERGDKELRFARSRLPFVILMMLHGTTVPHAAPSRAMCATHTDNVMTKIMSIRVLLYVVVAVGRINSIYLRYRPAGMPLRYDCRLSESDMFMLSFCLEACCCGL